MAVEQHHQREQWSSVHGSNLRVQPFGQPEYDELLPERKAEFETGQIQQSNPGWAGSLLGCQCIRVGTVEPTRQSWTEYSDWSGTRQRRRLVGVVVRYCRRQVIAVPCGSIQCAESSELCRAFRAC